MLFAQLQPGAQVSGPTEAAIKAAIEAAFKSSDRIISDGGILGACLILSLLGNIALVWLLVRVQNARVQDTLTVSKVAQDMVTTFGNVDNALKNLNDSSKNQQSALQSVAAAINTLMMGVIARGSNHSGPPTLPPGGITP
jgi:uncharacterized protein HemX